MLHPSKTALFWTKIFPWTSNMLHMYSTLYTCSALKYILQFMIACPLGSPSSNSKLYCLNCFMNPIQVLHLIKAAMTWYDKAFWMTKRCRVFLRTCYNHVGPFAQLNSWLNCGKKHLFMSEGSDVERWHLWLVLRPRQVEEAMLRQWVGEPGRCRLFCILLFQHFSLSFIQQIC